MNIQLAYGHRHISLDVPQKRVLSVVKARKNDLHLSQTNSVEEALRCPKNSPTLGAGLPKNRSKCGNRGQ